MVRTVTSQQKVFVLIPARPFSDGVCVGFPQVLSLDYKKLPYIASHIVKAVIGSSNLHDLSQNKQWLREYERIGIGLSIILYF